MTITAKVRKRMIENGRLVHAIVQGESNATTILFRIEGETDLVAEETLFLYLLYKRPNDQTVQLPILLDYTIEDGVILATFTPGAYFTADSGPVEISVIATSSAAVLGGSGEVTNTLLWSSFPAWLLVAPSQLADSSTIIEENVFTQYLAELEALDADAKDYASDAEEYAKGTRSDTQPVTHGSDNAKYYKNLAKDWAMKTGGPVEGVEMSAKVYAASSQNYATESQQWANKMDGKVLGTDYSAKYYAGEASDSATAAGLSADSAAASAGIVSDHATAIDAIYADLLNIDVVATDIQDDDSVIDAVAQNITNVNAVAGNESNINAVNSNKTNINAVAGSISNVNSVAGNIANVNAVAGNATNINAVKTNESNINKVAAIDGDVSMVAAIDDDVSKVADIYADVSAVAAIDSDVTAVSGIKTDVSAVANVASDVETVADELTDIGTVATNISDVSAVADDITKVTAVADDLTNIDAVADDLTNIDNAVNYALEAEGFAVGEQNGTPVSSGSPYYQNNAKYYSQEVPALKDAIRKDEARITNLEEKADPTGAYKTVNYRGTNDVPTGKAKYALVESIVGKSRAWNQLVTNGNFANGDNWTDAGFYATTRTVANNVMTLSSASGNVDVAQALTAPLVAGHKYLVSVTASRDVSGTLYTRLAGGGGNQDIVFSNVSTSLALKSEIVTADYSSEALVFFATGLTSSCQISRVILRDLTLIFPEGVPSTVAECVQKCPDILKYDAFGTSMVDTTVEGVISKGFNLWDEEWESGDINVTDGQKRADSERCRSKNFINVKPLTTYYTKTEYPNTTICCYDADGNWVSSEYQTGYFSGQNTTFTTPSWCHKVMLYYNGNTYNHDICINISGSLDGTYKPYVEPSTLTLPSSVTLRSAGSVADTDELNVEVLVDGQKVNRRRQTTRIKAVNLAVDFAWTLAGGTYEASISDAVYFSDIVSPRYHRNSVDNLSNLDEFGVIIRATKIYIKDSQGSPTGYMNYQLATESATLLDPIENNTIQTEGGGTINTIQTQTPVIDNSMDVGYLAL